MQSILLLFLVIVLLVGLFLALLLWLVAAGRRDRGRQRAVAAKSLELDAWRAAGERIEPYESPPPPDEDVEDDEGDREP